MEKQSQKNQQNEQNTQSSQSKVQQSRGPELREKMKQSEEKGDQYRAEHQGADARKTPGTSNSEKAH